jgi:tetratricopeptide (TPR) repeat protein
LGWFYEENNNLDSALITYGICLDIDSNNLEIRYQRAISFLKQNMINEAIKDLKIINRVNDKFSDVDSLLKTL